MSLRTNHLLLVVWLAFGFVAGCGSETPSAPAPSAQEAAPPVGRTAAKPVAQVRETRAELQHGQPRVRIVTSYGDVVVKLDQEKAPITVANFLDYVERGFYDGTIFHQVVDGYILLGGGFTSELAPKSAGAPIRNEAHNGLKNRKGTIAMARQFDTIDSSTSQFFLNLNDNPALDHKSDQPNEYGYCVFGEIIEGFETLEKIAKVPVQDTREFEMLPARTVVIESARLLR